MNVGVDQSRRDERALEIERLPRARIITNACDDAVNDRDIRALDLAGEDVDDLRIANDEIGRRIAARDG